MTTGYVLQHKNTYMAANDNGISFPIFFDLDAAVKKASQDWDGKYADQLEKAIQKRAIEIKLRVNTSNFDDLDAVKQRLAQLKIEPITPETKTAIKELAAELRTLAKALEQVQKYSARAGGTPEAVRNSRIAANEARARANAALEQQRAARTEYNLAAAREKAARAANVGTEATRRASEEYRKQDGYVSRLVKRLAVYASFSAFSGFLRNVRDVTAEFELQRVSLGAIIQDQTRANALFSEIKAFALKSPVSILDLTKYTKQIAAYRIETEKLFDTTKMLTDISVGLGVDLQRITLFFGQVRARGALFSSEIRQATEAGIPLVELLAKKYSELNGQLVTASQVLKMVEKGMVGFEMVEEIFKDMTSAGGMFYEMQEKQGNTLYGLWAKLGDAAAVMYDEIGNTESVNKGMKSAIQALTDLMKNWRDVARIATEAGIAFAVYRLAVIASTKATALATVWEKKDIVLRQMHLKTVMAQSMHVRNFNRVLLASGVSAQKASTATWVFSRALHGLKAAIATTGIGALIIGLSLLIDRLLFSKSAAEQLKESLDNIETESIQEQDKSVRNFERLANIAVSASSTYKEQQAALEELKRTYKEIIPQEQLTIENLKQMNGNYELLTASIRRYIAERMKQKQTDEIINTYASEILKIQRKVNDQLKNKYSAEQLAAFWEKYTEIVKDASKSAGKSVSELINMTVSAMGADLQFAHDIGSVWTLFAHDHADVSRMTTLIREQERQIDALSKTYDSASMAMGEYAKSYSEAVDKITQDGLKLKGKVIKQEDNPLLYSQQEANLEIKDAMIPTIKEAFNAAGIAFDDGWTSLIDNVDENMPQLTSSINFDPMVEKANEESQKLLAELQKQLVALVAQREAYLKQIKAEESKGKGGNDEVIQNAKTRYNKIGDEIEKLEERARKINILPQLLEHLKKKYEDLAPSDSVVKLMRQRFDSIVDYTKAYAKNMRRFRMNADEDMEAYRKRLSDEVELIKKNIKAWTAAMVLARLFRNKTEEQNLQNLIDEAKLQLKDLEKVLGDMPVFDKSKSRGGTKSDPRLQNLKEEISLLQKLYTEYKKLEKQEGAARAAEDIRKLAGATIDMFKSKYKIDLPTNADDLASSLEILYKKMAALGTKAFPTLKKDLNELRWTIENVKIENVQKNIESKLKRLSDRISRTKTAKEFYEKILGMTGDVELAANVAIHVYGEQGKDLNKQIREQIEKLLEPSGVKIDKSIFREDGTFDPKKLREFAEAQKDALGGIESKAYQELIKLSDNADKNFAKTIEGWLKAIEKAKSASDKMLDLARTTRTEIDKITAQKGYAQTRITELLGLGTRTDEQQQELENLQGFLDVADKLIQGFKDKQTKEQTSLAYEMFKDSPMYVQMFDDLDHASTAMLENMKTRIEGLKGAWKDLTPTQLKELQARMNEIDAQLAKRNPFKTLAKSISDYRKLRREGDSRGNKSEGAANADLMAASKAADEARKKYDELVKKYGKGSEKSVQEVIDAKDKLDRAMANEEAAQKAVENWKKVKDMIGLSANELFQMLNWAGDIAKGIADISEAMGADEEDVRYWNDVADALGQISGGIQDVVQSAMSGNVVGIISSTLTAIPKMFVGFTNLFSAGKIKRANKEIERQERILEELEYAYGRLEKAAERAFGSDYINNFKAQQRNLEAQARAYQAQANAERSKGKKADEDKIKEYENAYRETMDAIADMQGQIAAQMLGTDLTSAARDFAKAWIDAYKEFGSTADAMSEKFHEMIENMVVEGAMAKVMERALKPMFDMIDNMGEEDFYNEAFWKNVVSTAEQGAKDADAGASTLMKFLEQAGISMRALGGDMTGISREIAGASEESINGLAAMMNTQNYYASRLPSIDVNVARICAMMEGGGSGANAATARATDYTPMIRQSLENQGMMIRYQAETLAECKAQTELIRKVIIPAAQAKGSYKVYVGM